MENNATANRDIIYAIRKIAGMDGIKKAQLVMGTVTSVSDDETSNDYKTCNVDITLGDACQSITGVHLNASSNDGFTQFPAVNSDILIALMPDNSAYMVACEDIDKVICYIDSNNKFEFDSNGFIWNGGNNDGLVKVIQLTQKLNNLENKVNSIISIYNSHTHTASSFGSPTTPPSAPVTGTLTPTTQTEIQNNKIKH